MAMTAQESARLLTIRANVRGASRADQQWALDLFNREFPAGSSARDAKCERILAKAAAAGYVPKSNA